MKKRLVRDPLVTDPVEEGEHGVRDIPPQKIVWVGVLPFVVSYGTLPCAEIRRRQLGVGHIERLLVGDAPYAPEGELGLEVIFPQGKQPLGGEDVMLTIEEHLLGLRLGEGTVKIEGDGGFPDIHAEMGFDRLQRQLFLAVVLQVKLREPDAAPLQGGILPAVFPLPDNEIVQRLHLLRRPVRQHRLVDVPVVVLVIEAAEKGGDFLHEPLHALAVVVKAVPFLPEGGFGDEQPIMGENFIIK